MDDLCTACLCNGRNLYFIDQTGSYQLYTDILNEIPIYEVAGICVKVCWECRYLLRRFQNFKQQVQRSYSQLLDSILLQDTSKTQSHNAYTPIKSEICDQNTNISMPPRLKIQHVFNINYPQIEIKSENDDDPPSVDCLKSEEEEYCETTFVNDLQAPVKEKRNKKDDKKPHNKKVKKKQKYKQQISSSDESIQIDRSDGLSDLDSVLEYYEDGEPSEIDIKAETERDNEDKSVLEHYEEEESKIESKIDIEIDNKDKSDLEYYEDSRKSELKSKRQAERDSKNNKSVLECYEDGRENELKSKRKTERNSKNNKSGLEHYEDSRVSEIENKRKRENKEIEISKEVIKRQKKNGEIKLKVNKSNKDTTSDKPQCVECGKIFSSKKTYRYHLNVLHKGQNQYPCPRCGKVYQWKSNLGRHMRSHKARDTGELYCDMCDKRFASVATYRQHLKVSRRHVSESEFTFTCNDCGKKFVNKTRLRDHIDWEHLNKIKFRCHQCHKPFKCHTSLYVHEQNVHRNKEKKDNLCHVCGKSYQNAAKLKYHIVAMHTSETPYRCPQCTAAFGWYSSLYRHLREVHHKMKAQPKKSKRSKKLPNEVLPSLIPPQQIVLPNLYQPGPP